MGDNHDDELVSQTFREKAEPLKCCFLVPTLLEVSQRLKAKPGRYRRTSCYGGKMR